jgi:hypothetical protein
MSMLQRRLDEFKQLFESRAPPHNVPCEAIEKMLRATAALKAWGLETAALKVGERAPSFKLFNQDRTPVSSAALLRDGPLIVSFFHERW